MTFDRIRLTKRLGADEGVRRYPYVDTVGKTTIGIGRNLTGKGLSAGEIAVLFENDLNEAIAELNRELPWWTDLDPVRQEVLINMMFNLGSARLLKFKNTLAAIKQGRYAAAAIGMRASLWATQVGARAERLAREMETGGLQL